MKYYIEIDGRDIGRFRIDKPCQGSHGNCVLVLKDKYNMTVGFELLTVGFELLPQRPHGEWVKDFNMDKAIVCSECGEEAWYKEYCGWVTKSNFCPNCGADMRKRGEAE